MPLKFEFGCSAAVFFVVHYATCMYLSVILGKDGTLSWSLHLRKLCQMTSFQSKMHPASLVSYSVVTLTHGRSRSLTVSLKCH